MTNVDHAEAVAVTIHSRAATDTELLTTEFIACYLTADIAWQYNNRPQKALAGTQRNPARKVADDNKLGFKSLMRGLPVSSIYALSATPYLLLLIQIRLVSGRCSLGGLLGLMVV
jgi:hypothetical protein